jgi:hypothetical protein
LETLMRAGAFERAIWSDELRAAAQIAATKDKLDQLANGGGNNPLGASRRGIGF